MPVSAINALYYAHTTLRSTSFRLYFIFDVPIFIIYIKYKCLYYVFFVHIFIEPRGA